MRAQLTEHYVLVETDDIDFSTLKLAVESLQELVEEPAIETELSKGILVCANCHREIHYGFYPEYLLK